MFEQLNDQLLVNSKLSLTPHQIDLNLNFLMIKNYGPKNPPPGLKFGSQELGLVLMIQIWQVPSECGPSNLVVLEVGSQNVQLLKTVSANKTQIFSTQFYKMSWLLRSQYLLLRSNIHMQTCMSAFIPKKLVWSRGEQAHIIYRWTVGGPLLICQRYSRSDKV